MKLKTTPRSAQRGDMFATNSTNNYITYGACVSFWGSGPVFHSLKDSCSSWAPPRHYIIHNGMIKVLFNRPYYYCSDYFNVRRKNLAFRREIRRGARACVAKQITKQPRFYRIIIIHKILRIQIPTPVDRPHRSAPSSIILFGTNIIEISVMALYKIIVY